MPYTPTTEMNTHLQSHSLYRQQIWSWGLLWDWLSNRYQSHPAATCTKTTPRAYSLQLLVTKLMTQSGSKPSLLWHCSVVLCGFGFGVKKGSHAYSEIVFGYLEHWSTDMYSRSQAI